MKYEYINSAKYNLNTITKAFEHESRNDFFRICKILKFTIHPYPGPQKNKKKIEDLDRWLKGRLTDEEGRIWDRILRESGYINRLYKDLYSDEEYEQANAIDGSRELSAYLMFVEYYLTSLLNSVRGRNDLNDLLGIQSDLGEIPDVNERMLCYGELFDHVSIEIKNALEYIAFYKNHNQICDRVDTKEILKAKGHLLSVMKKKIIDQIVESWQFGDPVIAMDQDVFLCEQDDWGNRIRTYWEMRERSTYTTSMLAAEQYPVSTDNEEQQEFDRTNFILQRQLYADLSDCRCEIVGKEGACRARIGRSGMCSKASDLWKGERPVGCPASCDRYILLYGSQFGCRITDIGSPIILGEWILFPGESVGTPPVSIAEGRKHHMR